MGSEVDENEMKSAHVDDTGGEQQGDQESSGTPEANATEPTEPAPAHGAGYGETKIETSEPNDLRAVIERGNHKQLQDLLKGDRARSLLQVKYGGSNGRTDSTDLFSGTTPLLHAAIRGRQDIFSTLLYNSPATLLADRDDGGRTLGHLAALSNDTETFKALLKELVKGRMRRIHIPKRTVLDILTLRDKAGNTVLMIAADVGNDAIFTATVDVMASRLRQDKTKMGGSRNFPCGKRPTAMQELRKGNKDNFEAEIEKAKQAGGAEEVIPKLRGIFESEDAIGETLLSHAVYCGEVEMFNLVWDYATSTNCLTPSELGGLIAYQNAFGESLLAKAFDSGKHELFNAVLKCAWELREYLTYHQLRDFIESPDVHEEPRSVAVAHGGDFCTMLLLRAFDLADLGLLEAAVYFVSNRTAVYPDHIVDDVLRKTEQSGSTFWQIVDDLRKSDAFGPHSKVPIKMAEKRSREMNDLLTSLVDEHLNSGTRSDDDLKIISSLVANSAQPDGNGLMKLSRLHKDGDLFKDCCMRAVCSAVNPFIPGITLSIKLAEASKQANEGDRRTISDIQSNVDNLLLEIFERLPQTVDGFEGGIDGCTAIFEPSLLKSSDSGSLEGPLGMILSEQQQLETFCKVPLVMDFLSSKFTLGLRYLNDFQHYRRRIDGMENIGTDLTLDSPVGRFVQTATLTFLPGLQFVVAGMVAAPDSYYQVPAMRMMLDFVVYAIMIAALSNFVLFHSAAGSIAVVDQIVDHRFSVSEGACATIFIAGGILREWREMKRNIRRYFRDQWNVLDALGILCLLIGMVIRWDDWTSPWGPAFYALSAPLVVSRVLFFAQILPFQGPMIQVIFHMTSTLLQFGAVMLVVMIGFAMALHVLFRDVDSFGETFLGLFKAMLGDTDFFDEFSGGRYDRVATILVVIYLFTVTIMLLNLLVAILSTAHAQVQGNTGGTFKVVKARIVDHYRLVVDEDLLPAPFNLVQLLLSMVEVTFAVLYYYVAELRRNAENVKVHDTTAALARWALTSEKTASRAERGRRSEAEKNEMELANVELVARRSARLKNLYQDLNDRYEMELNARGLALAKERA
eukprot:g7897.t2